MKYLYILATCLFASCNCTATSFHYTVSGTFHSRLIGYLNDGEYGHIFDDALRVSNSTEDLIDSLGGVPFVLSFSQDTGVPISSGYGGSAGYANAIRNLSLTVDGSPVSIGALGDLFVSTDFPTQHQWSFLGAGADGSIDPILDDGSVVADYEFVRDGDLLSSSLTLQWRGIKFFGFDEDKRLFANSPPENGPFYNHSFDARGDSFYLYFDWVGFGQVDDGFGNPLDIKLEVSLSATVTGYTSTAVGGHPGVFPCSDVSPLDIDTTESSMTVIDDCIVNIQSGADISHLTYVNSSTVNFFPGGEVSRVMGVGNSSAEFNGGSTVGITLVNESRLTVRNGGFGRISVYDNAELVVYIQDISITDTGLGHRVTGYWSSGEPADFLLYFAGDSGVQDPNLSAGDSTLIPALPTPLTSYGPVDNRLVVIDGAEPAITLVPIPYFVEFALIVILLFAYKTRIAKPLNDLAN